MKTFKALTLAAILLFTLCSLASGQITPSDDAYVNSAAPTANYGAATTLNLQSVNETGFIRFDLTAVPAGYTSASIAKATLKLYVNTVATAGSFNVDLVNGTWTEKTITHNLQPAIGTSIQSSIPLTTANKGEYVEIDITSAVGDWLDGTQPNDGIALVGNSPLVATFDSKENAAASHPPEIDIVFAAIAGVTTASGSGLVGGGTTGTLNLALTNTCSANQVLKWNGSAWACSAVGTGTITGVSAGTDLTGGGTSGTVALNVDLTRIPQLGTANSFTGNQTVNGTVAATAFTGNGSGLTNVNASQLGGSAANTFATLSGNTFNGTQFIGGSGTSATLQMDANGVNPGSLLPGIRFGVGASGEGMSSQRTGAGNLNGLDFYTNSTARISITNTGNVGIGTRTPGAGLDVASGGVLVEGTQDGSGTSLVPNQILFQDNGEIASLDASHRIIFDRSSNYLELREFGTIVFSPGATSAQRTAEIQFTPTAADVFYNFNVTGLTTMGSAPQTAQLAIASTTPLDGADVTGYSSPIGSGGVGTRGIQGTGGNADPSKLLIASDGVDGTGGNSVSYSGGTGIGGTGGSGSAGGSGGAFYGGAGTHDGGVGIFAFGYGYVPPVATYGGTGAEFFGGSGTSDGADALYANTSAPNHYAGNFNGDVAVTGTLTAATKNFKIDHPLDPANKYLVHASVESSELMDIYTGNVTTDAAGDAVVHLPDWFEALNADFRYQLTVIGQFAQAIVSQEISNRRFTVKTDKPNVRVSWQVTGVRQDAYAKAHPLVVEQMKTGRESGYYLHPALFGAGEEQGIAAAQHPEALRFAREMRERAATRTMPDGEGANHDLLNTREQAIAAAASLHPASTLRPSVEPVMPSGSVARPHTITNAPATATAPHVPAVVPPSNAKPVTQKK